MSTPGPTTDPVIAARLSENAARQRLSAAVAELRFQLDPNRVARNTAEQVRTFSNEAAQQVRTFSSEAAQTAAAQVRAHPGLAAGTAGAVALLVLRRPVVRLLSRLFTRRKRPRLPPEATEAEIRRFSAQIGQPAPVGLLSQEG